MCIRMHEYSHPMCQIRIYRIPRDIVIGNKGKLQFAIRYKALVRFRRFYRITCRKAYRKKEQQKKFFKTKMLH
jgi:hypothetical protein